MKEIQLEVLFFGECSLDKVIQQKKLKINYFYSTSSQLVLTVSYS